LLLQQSDATQARFIGQAFEKLSGGHVVNSAIDIRIIIYQNILRDNCFLALCEITLSVGQVSLAMLKPGIRR
jgi:hypothetical protein